MAFQLLNIGTKDNDGTGETLKSAMEQCNANDIAIEADINTLIANRVTALNSCAELASSNVFQKANAIDGFQRLEGSSVQFDFSNGLSPNFYLPHGTNIYLDEPIGMKPNFYPRGYIITEGWIHNWADIFKESREGIVYGADNLVISKPYEVNDFPSGDDPYAGKWLYEYVTLSETLIVFYSMSGVVAIPDEIEPPTITEYTTQVKDGTYNTQLIVTWEPNAEADDIPSQYKVLVTNTDNNVIVYNNTIDSNDDPESQVTIPDIVDFGDTYEVAITSVDGQMESDPVTDTIIPTGNLTIKPPDVINFSGTVVGGRVNLSWDKPTITADYDNIDHYEIRYSTPNSVTWANATLIDDVYSLAVTINGLADDTNYYFYIKSIDKEGQECNNASSSGLMALPSTAENLYVADLLESSAISITTNSEDFIKVYGDGTGSGYLQIGKGGIIGHDGTDPTFTLDAKTGDATFAGDITGATGTFGDVIISGSLSSIDGDVLLGTQGQSVDLTLTEIDNAQAEAESKAEVHYSAQASIPTGKEGDIWVVTDDNNHLYRCNATYPATCDEITTNEWESIRDGNIAEAYSLADEKIVTFVADETPIPTGAYGDLWINLDDGNKLYRCFNSGGDCDAKIAGEWQEVQDDGITTAITTANEKIKTFYQISAPSGQNEEEGDLWFDTNDGYRLWIYESSTWVDIQDELIDTAKTIADSKIETFAGTSIPTTGHYGDIWIDTGDDNKIYRCYNSGTCAATKSDTEWKLLRDSGIQTALDDSLQAISDAADKAKVFYQSSIPTAVENDIWINSNNNRMYVCTGTTCNSINIGEWEESGKTFTYAQASVPTGFHYDIWIDTDDENQLYRCESVTSGSCTAIGTEDGFWHLLRDGEITSLRSNLDSPSYLSNLLNNSSIAIEAGSENFLKLQSSSTQGIFLGSAGLFGKTTSGGSAEPTDLHIPATDENFGLWDNHTGCGSRASTPTWKTTDWIAIDGINTVKVIIAGTNTNGAWQQRKWVTDAYVCIYKTALADPGTFYLERGTDFDSDAEDLRFNYSIDYVDATIEVYDDDEDLAQVLTTFSIDATTGEATFRGTLTAADGVFTGTITGSTGVFGGITLDGASSSISGTVPLGASTATDMISATATAQSTANAKAKTFAQDTEPSGEGETESDLWIDTNDNNKLWRYNGSIWVDMQDDDIGLAQATADGKIVTFAQDAEPSGDGESIGDLWIDTNDGNKLWRHNGSIWIDTQDTAIADAQAAADGKIITYAQDGIPDDGSYGDMWIDTNDGNKLYRCFHATLCDSISEGEWQEVQDDDITTAINDSSSALTLAGEKAKFFFQDAIPTGVENDYWIDSNDGNKLFKCVNAAGCTTINETTGWKSITSVTSYSQNAIPTTGRLGDLWIDTDDDNKLYRCEGSLCNTINAGEWVLYRDGEITQLRTDLDSPSYLSTLLNDSAIDIEAGSTSFIKLQSSDSQGVFIGTAGIFGKTTSGGSAEPTDLHIVANDLVGYKLWANHTGCTAVTESGGRVTDWIAIDNIDTLKVVIGGTGDLRGNWQQRVGTTCTYKTAITGLPKTVYLERGTDFDNDAEDFRICYTFEYTDQTVEVYDDDEDLAQAITTFSIDATDGSATFGGELTAASGTFSGTVTSTTQMNVTHGAVNDYAGKFVNSLNGNGVLGEVTGTGSTAFGVVGKASGAESTGVWGWANNSSASCVGVSGYTSYAAAIGMEATNISGGTAFSITAGYTEGDFIPKVTKTDTLGDASHDWSALYVDDIFLDGDIMPNDETSKIGSSTVVFSEINCNDIIARVQGTGYGIGMNEYAVRHMGTSGDVRASIGTSDFPFARFYCGKSTAYTAGTLKLKLVSIVSGGDFNDVDDEITCSYAFY